MHTHKHMVKYNQSKLATVEGWCQCEGHLCLFLSIPMSLYLEKILITGGIEQIKGFISQDEAQKAVSFVILYFVSPSRSWYFPWKGSNHLVGISLWFSLASTPCLDWWSFSSHRTSAEGKQTNTIISFSQKTQCTALFITVEKVLFDVVY